MSESDNVENKIMQLLIEKQYLIPIPEKELNLKSIFPNEIRINVTKNFLSLFQIINL